MTNPYKFQGNTVKGCWRRHPRKYKMTAWRPYWILDHTQIQTCRYLFRGKQSLKVTSKQPHRNGDISWERNSTKTGKWPSLKCMLGRSSLDVHVSTIMIQILQTPKSQSCANFKSSKCENSLWPWKQGKYHLMTCNKRSYNWASKV